MARDLRGLVRPARATGRSARDTFPVDRRGCTSVILQKGWECKKVYIERFASAIYRHFSPPPLCPSSSYSQGEGKVSSVQN